MKVLLRHPLVKRLGKQELKKFGIKDDVFEWKEDVTLDLKRFNEKKCKELANLLQPYTRIYGTKTCIKEIETYLASKSGEYPVMFKVKLFEEALIQYLLPQKRRWLYHKAEGYENQWVATSVTKIQFQEEEKPTRDHSGHPAYVHVDFIYQQFATVRWFSEDFFAEDIMFKKVPEILALRGYYIETQELRNNYLEHLKKYRRIIHEIGKQFILDGVAVNQVPDDVEERDGISGGGNVVKEKIRDYVVNKVVIDVFREKQEEDLHRWSNYDDRHHEDGGYFWRYNEKDYDEESEFDRDPVIETPIHPFVIIFDLQRHLRLSTHVTTLTEYKYDKAISEKLILPDQIKELINILIEHKSGNFVDIIRGKSGGAIVLLTGKAGVGKTLTAEVFAEATERPLYSVQASQLGIDAVQLEQNLKMILRRASRWNAVLLLDEADVYVGERGTNLIQNAIVGVFLRVLEYHSSLMFLTTNRPEIVDDAIASRCIARIDYKYPSTDDQKKIWDVLSQTSNIKLSDEMINEIVSKHNKLSGRDIKNMLKLANLQALSKGEKLGVAHVSYVKQFSPTMIEDEDKKK